MQYKNKQEVYKKLKKKMDIEDIGTRVNNSLTFTQLKNTPTYQIITCKSLVKVLSAPQQSTLISVVYEPGLVEP